MLMTATHREPIVLDTTVRDGSYAVNFQYTDDDVRRIVGDLDAREFPTLKSVTASPSEPPRRRARRLTPTKNISAPPDRWFETRDLVP